MRGLVKTGVAFLMIFIAISLLILSSPAQAPSYVENNKFRMTFDMEPGLAKQTLYITIENLQDDSDNLDMKTIIMNTNFPADLIRDSKFHVQQKEEFEVEDSDYVCNPYTIEANDTIYYYDNCSWVVTGSHLEERMVWKEKPLLYKQSSNQEYKEKWENVPIQKAGQEKSILRFKLVFNTPIIETETGWGSSGKVYLDLNNQLFYDFEHSSWWDTDYGYRYEIQSNATGEWVINVNDTFVPNVWTKNATAGETIYLYCKVSGCATDDIAIGNATDELNWENDASRSGNNPEEMWAEQNAPLVLHMMNESDIVYDSSANSYDFTNNGAFEVDGVFGKALDFEADDSDYLSDTVGIDWSNGVTVCAWIKYETPATSGIAVAGTSVSPANFDLHTCGALQNYCTLFYIYTSSGMGTAYCIDDISDTNWHYICGIWNTTDMFAYIDGALGSGANAHTLHSGTAILSTEPLYVGRRTDGSDKMDGLIDEVRVYNESKSATWVLEQYYNGINKLVSLGAEETANTTPIVSLYNITGITNDNTPGIDFNFTDDDLLANCSLLLNGTLYAYNESTENATQTTLIPSVLGLADYEVNVSCSDGTLSNVSSSIILTVDSTPPQFSNYKNSTTPNEDQNVELNVTVTDNHLDTVTLELGNTTDVTNYTVTPSVDSEYYITITSGYYTAHDNITWFWYANDTANNLNRSSQQEFTVANRVPDIPQLYSPSNGSGYAMGSTIEFIWNNSFDADAEDTGNLVYILEISNNSAFPLADRIYLNDSIEEGATGNSTSISITLSSYTSQDDDYFWRVNATDTYDNGTSSPTRTFQYANWTITFEMISAETAINLTEQTKIHCYDSLNNEYWDTLDQPGDDVPSPWTAGKEFAALETYSCTFEVTGGGYYPKTKNFTADDNKGVSVIISKKGYLTQEEHDWLEAIYDCLHSGSCAMYNLLLNVNTTVTKVWNQYKRTDQSVVVLENITQRTVNTTDNLTIDYSINVPVKEGYTVNETSGEIRLDYLPIRISYWFLNETNETCHSQGNYSVGLHAEPYCIPLTVYTVGQIGSTINFTVELKPDLDAGIYYIVRNIEVDPPQVWINYGQEVIGSVDVLEDNSEIVISLENTGVSPEPTLGALIPEAPPAPLTGLAINIPLISIISITFSILAVGLFGYFYISFRKRYY